MPCTIDGLKNRRFGFSSRCRNPSVRRRCPPALRCSGRVANERIKWARMHATSSAANGQQRTFVSVRIGQGNARHESAQAKALPIGYASALRRPLF